jgi:hypothetical protein
MRKLKYCTYGLKGRAAKKIWTGTAAERREKLGLFGKDRVNKERLQIPPGNFFLKTGQEPYQGAVLFAFRSKNPESVGSPSISNLLKRGAALKNVFLTVTLSASES